MNSNTIQPMHRSWMLLYTFFFAYVCILGTQDDIECHYPLVVILWNIFGDIVMFIGNFLYSLNRVPKFIKKPWKIVFPFVIFQFVFICVYDFQHPTPLDHPTLIEFLSIYLPILLLLIFPTFRAHYLIGYRE